MKKLIKIQAVLLSAIIMLGSSASLYAGHIKSGKTPKKTSTARRLGWNKASRNRLRKALDRQEKAQQAVRRQEAAMKATQQTVGERIKRTGYSRDVLGRVGESRLPVGSEGKVVAIHTGGAPSLKDIMTSPELPDRRDVSPLSLLKEGEEATPENIEKAKSQYFYLYYRSRRYITDPHLMKEILSGNPSVGRPEHPLISLKRLLGDGRLGNALTTLMHKRIARDKDIVDLRRKGVKDLEDRLAGRLGNVLPRSLQTELRLGMRNLFVTAQYLQLKHEALLERMENTSKPTKENP